MSVPPETLVSYVPEIVARRFAVDPSPLSAPVAERFPAAVLFADITGYTRLAGRLAQHGPAGAEELIRLLNAYFGQLIDVVIAHGGDIVKFAGDAALVLWPAIDEGLDIVTQRAAQCGLDMQTTLGQYEVSDGLRLSQRVGIGAGEVLTASVGGVYRRWEFLVAGAPLAQMSAAQRQAEPGQVVLSPEAWELVQERCQGSPIPLSGAKREGVPSAAFMLLGSVREPLRLRSLTRVTPPPGSEVALRGYIPGAILSRLGAGQTEWLSELRRVTVVFLNVTGLNYAAPDALDRVQATMQALQTALYHYEGSVNQFIVDDKGTTLVAAFGLPPLTHEDDAVRGVQAAMMMQTRLRELNLRSAIGVTTGQVYSGERGNVVRREYAMVGNVVNMAARLMQAAAKYGGGTGFHSYGVPILCDDVTYQAARTRLMLEALSPIMVKGKTEPIPVYRPRGVLENGEVQRPAAQPKTAIVGRRQEKAMLGERLQSLLRGEAEGIVVIEGEAGIGKTRLVDTVLQQARVLHVRCLVGAGDAVERSTPYHAWRGIFSQLFGLGTIADPQARRERVLEQLQSSPGLLRLAPLLNSILPLDLPDNETTQQMDGQVRADNTRDLLIRLLQTSASQAPIVLVLEDAHWMDSASWLLALAVGQQVRPLVLIIVTRPLTGSLPEEYRQLLLFMTSMQWVRLEAMPLEDIIFIVGKSLGVSNLPDMVVALIQEKAQGNPFFSEELAFALRDAGLIVIDGGECRISPGAYDFSALGLPDTVQGVITSRIDRLTPPQQLTLKVASVIGRVFGLRILRDIYPLEADKDQLADNLAILQQLDLTPLEKDGSNPVYAFKSVVIQEAAYNLMLFAQRRQLHQAIAEWYEATFEDLSSLYPLLAHHWSKAVEDHPNANPSHVLKAIDYLEKAGEQALRNYANQEAVLFFSEALKLDKAITQRMGKRGGENDQAGQGALHSEGGGRLRWVRWERQLGEAYLSMGHLAESLEHLERAAALLNRPVPTTRPGLAISLAKQIMIQALHRLGAGRALKNPTLPAISDQPEKTKTELLEATRAYWALGQVYFYANEKILNINANLHSLNLAEGVGPSPELARSYASVCVSAGLVRRHWLARAYSRWAQETAQQVEHLPSLVWVLLVTAVYDAGVGNWPQARELVRQAVEISNRRGDRRRWEQSLNTLATVACLQGEFVGIASLFADLYKSAQRRGDAQYQVYGLLGQARCLLPTGEIDKALSLLDTMEPLLVGEIGRVEEIYAYGMLALTHLRQGQFLAQEGRLPETCVQLAWQAADKAAQLIAQSRPISYNLIYAYAGVAEVYLSLWENYTDLSVGRRKTLVEAACQSNKALHDFALVFPIGRPSAWILQGLEDWLSGSFGKAHRAWRKGLAAAEELQMSYEEGLACYEIGRHATNRDERQTHLARAKEIFARLGAMYDLARVQAVWENS